MVEVCLNERSGSKLCSKASILGRRKTGQVYRGRGGREGGGVEGKGEGEQDDAASSPAPPNLDNFDDISRTKNTGVKLYMTSASC